MSTQEIPIVPGAAVNTQHLPPPPGPVAEQPSAAAEVPGAAMRTTGPVEHVPDPPATGPTTLAGPVPPPAATGPAKPADRRLRPLRRARRPRAGRAGLAAAALAVLSVVLLELGVALPFGTRSLWSASTLWSAFATGAAVVAVLAVLGQLLLRRAAEVAAWRAAAAGLTGLAVFWVLVVLPLADTDRGFLLTAAVACLGGAVWLGPARRRRSS